VICDEYRIEDQDKEGYRSLWEMLQSPVRYTVRAPNLANLHTPDDFLKLFGVR